MPTLSLAEQMNLNTMLVNTLRQYLPDMPDLTGLHQALEDVVSEGRVLEDQKGFHEYQLRQTNAKRRELERRGRELRLRLASSLRGRFGPESHNLLEFGVKPRAVRRRRTTTLPEVPTVEDGAA